MKKFPLVLLFFFAGKLAFAQENFSLSWANTAIKADGNAHDWDLPLKHYDPNTKLFFDFKNDNNNLYLCFQSKDDEPNQLKILKAGMKITLNTKINGKHKATIDFPLPSEGAKPAQTENATGAESQFFYRKTQAVLIAGDTLMEMKGFTSPDGIVSSKSQSGINAAINTDDNNMLTYEVVIPLKQLLGNDFDIKDLSKDILLTATINALKKSAHPMAVMPMVDFPGREVAAEWEVEGTRVEWGAAAGEWAAMKMKTTMPTGLPCSKKAN